MSDGQAFLTPHRVDPEAPAVKLVLLRHGESIWNRENRFTGWTDVDLSPRGVKEAHQAAALLREGGYIFDVAFTSVLKRAVRTLQIVLRDLDMMSIPVRDSWRLNERHYGALQGRNKTETALEHGAEQVHVWRRSYDVLPPALERCDPRHPGNDPAYGGIGEDELPAAESLKDTVARFLPYWYAQIVPELRAGQRVLIAAHGNSLRALVKHLDGTSDGEIPELNIPTGIPLVYELNGDLGPLRHYYLGAAAAEVATNTGAGLAQHPEPPSRQTGSDRDQRGGNDGNQDAAEGRSGTS